MVEGGRGVEQDDDKDLQIRKINGQHIKSFLLFSMGLKLHGFFNVDMFLAIFRCIKVNQGKM
jgi:hypothetical protein